MTTMCPKCGGTMERGFTTAFGLFGGDKSEAQEGQLLFIVAGTPTSRAPVKAFRQGLSDEPANRGYRIVGARCSECGFLEFYGDRERIVGP
jgi:hypothetical protein